MTSYDHKPHEHYAFDDSATTCAVCGVTFREAPETTETTDSTAGLFYVLTRRYIMGDDDTMSELHDTHESPAMTHQAATDYARVLTSTDLGILDARFEITVEKVECWDCPNQAVGQFATGDFCAEHAPVEAVETATETDQAAPVADPLFPFRIRIHPAHDLFMRGIKFATVTGATLESVKVRQDGTGKSFRIRNEYILPVDDTGTLTWQIVVPPHGPVDETFAPSYLDALAFARSVHGSTAVIRLTGWESN